MPRRRSSTDSTPFDTLRLEGSLFVPELLERAARGEAASQKEADYAIPKGLKLHDEYGRAYRIATALWQDFGPQLPRTDNDPAKATHAFVLDLLRQCLGYTDLSLLSSPLSPSPDRGFPITAQALGGRLPVIIAPHSLGLDDPDPRFAVHGAGARRKSAHQLAQEFLNASRDCLWAIVTNGRSLRLLRDAETLTRPNFLEFDLETILREGEDRYADFSALWRILHASRAGTATALPADCIWEKWKTEGHAQGLRVRDGLRAGVQEALLILGTGFLAHRDNDALRQRLHDGTLTKEDYFQQLLRLVYRCLFLFCAEERDLLHTPAPSSVRSDPSVLSSHTAARKAYAEGYSLRRLRNRSLRQAALTAHGDLWQGQTIVFRALATGQPRLALPALGGLFAESQCPDLDTAALANRDLLAAMRHLRWSSASGSLTAIDYRNMGPEELGSVYESLLELVPQLDLPARSFGFVGITTGGSTSGNARKTTGSYYTPDSLVQELIKSALDPVIADRLAARPDRPIEALLSITVCDPSCGSGHFLLAAARRLAEKLAELRAPDGAVRPDDYRHALRDVASRCLYGVDINPMAVELCRVALWLETVDPGKPLGFLDHHIRTGNSLLGTTPDLIAAGLPDDTFTAIEGDDKAACAELKKRNKKEREGFGPLFEKEEQTIRDRLRQAATAVEDMDESDLAHRDQKEAEFRKAQTTADYRHAKLLADLWCAAFVIKKHYPTAAGESQISNPKSQIAPIEGHLLHTQDELFGQPTTAPTPKAASKPQPRTKNQEQGTASGITTSTLRHFVQGQALPEALEKEVTHLASQYRFFHWHLAFPQVFDQGGFACILGNPPWEKINLKDEEYFANSHPQIAAATNKSARKALIEALKYDEPNSYQQYMATQEMHDRISVFFRFSQRYPFTGISRINLYSVFCETGLGILAARGRVGMVLASGIVTDENNKALLAAVIGGNRLVHAWDFENREGIFPDVDSRYKFCLFCAGGIEINQGQADFAFYLTSVDQLSETERHFTLTSQELVLLNPNSQTCPSFRNSREAEVTKLIYRRVLPWELQHKTKSWPGSPKTPFNMSNDSALFADRDSVKTLSSDGATFLSLYESKFVHQFNHRFATFTSDTDAGAQEFSSAELMEPSRFVESRYWLSKGLLNQRFGGRWFLTYRKIARATDERTSISAVIPESPCGDSLILIEDVGACEAALLNGLLNSFVFDYCARQKVSGTNFNHWIWHQLPMPSLDLITSKCLWDSTGKDLRNWFLPRVLELTYTAWDLEAFAADCGWSGPPFRWDEERRFLLRCELDAAFFHLYLGSEAEWRQQPEALTRAFPTPRHAVSYIMDTFPIVKRKDETKHGHYRTKQTILQIYDALGAATKTGVPYQTLLNPPPADPACCHPPRETISRIAPKHWQDSAFTLLAPVRKKVHNYPVAVWPELIRQWDKDLDFETFRKAFWLLCESDQFEREGRKLLPDIPSAWWKSRQEKLEASDFIPSLKGSATIGDLKIWRKDGSRLIRWTGSLREGLVHETVDDARVALQIASQLSVDPSEEAMDMAGIESLLQTLETA